MQARLLQTGDEFLIRIQTGLGLTNGLPDGLAVAGAVLCGQIRYVDRTVCGFR